jgi:lysophospholipase L1-like esterase
MSVLFGSEPRTWLFAGDSITQGAQHTHGWRSFPQHFEERVRYEMRRMGDTVLNTGVSGNEAIDLVPAFAERVARWHPSVVFLMLGTNDAVRGNAGETIFRTNLTRLVTDIARNGGIPMLQTPPPVQPSASLMPVGLEQYVEIVREVAAANDVLLVDHHREWLASGDGKPPADWMNDAIHPNERGHLAMAKTIFTALDIFDPASQTCGLTIP